MMETFTPGNGVKAIKTSSPRSCVITATLSVCTFSPAKHQLSSSSQVHDKAMAKSGFWKLILGIGILFEPFPTILVILGCLTMDWLSSTTGIYSSLFWRLGRLRPRFQGNLVSWWRLSFCFEEVHVFAVTLYRGERGRKTARETECESKHSFVYSYKGINLILRASSKLNYLPKPHLQIPSQ